MREYEFLKTLREELSLLPHELREDIIRDFEEHFEEGMAKGKSAEEIAANLGDPKIIAEEYLGRYREKLNGFDDQHKDDVIYNFDLKTFFNKMFSKTGDKLKSTIVEDELNQRYSLSDVDIISLYVDLAGVKLREVDRDDIWVSVNSKTFAKSDTNVTVVGRTLLVEQKILKNKGVNFNNIGENKIIIEVPKNSNLDLNLDVDMGSVLIEGNFNRLNVDSDMGNVTVNGDFGQVNIDSDMGSVKSEYFSGVGKIESDMGSIKLNISDAQKGRIVPSVDMGKIKINKQKFPITEGNTVVIDESHDRLLLETDMGSITIK